MIMKFVKIFLFILFLATDDKDKDKEKDNPKQANLKKIEEKKKEQKLNYMINKLDKDKNALISDINFLKNNLKNLEKENFIERISTSLRGLKEILEGYKKSLVNFHMVFENSVEINREMIGIERNMG